MKKNIAILASAFLVSNVALAQDYNSNQLDVAASKTVIHLLSRAHAAASGAEDPIVGTYNPESGSYISYIVGNLACDRGSFQNSHGETIASKIKAPSSCEVTSGSELDETASNVVGNLIKNAWLSGNHNIRFLPDQVYKDFEIQVYQVGNLVCRYFYMDAGDMSCSIVEPTIYKFKANK